MKFEIKKFNELTVDDMYEIAKSRFEVFVCEQEITEEQDFDDKDKVCHHVMLKENGRVVAYSRIVPKGVGYENISIGRVLVLNSHRRKGIAQNRGFGKRKNETLAGLLLLAASPFGRGGIAKQ